ncbi:MAG: hypothetical protein AB1778_04850 [Candidatus Bipolaricaulota bacterium]
MRDVQRALTTREVYTAWWPLAASWLLMALEGPLQTIVVARLAAPEIHLAAFGSLVLPISMFIEAPIIMLLAASTALCVDLPAYLRIRRFMHRLSAGLTAIHVLVAVTPLYDLVVVGALGAPAETVEPARIGLILMIPWTWSIAYRRFQQGVLIRYGHSMTVGIGTVVRLSANAVVLVVGFALRGPGTLVASAAIAAGVLSEAAYAGLRVRPVLRTQVPADAGGPPLSGRDFFRFYVPLSLTSLVLLGVRPILTAAVGRMPDPLESLAVLPVVNGLVFLFRSVGAAYSEVVIATLGRPGSTRAVARFAGALALATTAGLVVITVTPLSSIWFGWISGLSGPLAALAKSGLWLTLTLPAAAALQSYFQGFLVYSRKTRSLTEAVLIYLAATVALLAAGAAWAGAPGVSIALASISVGEWLRTGWFAWRSRSARQSLAERDRIATATAKA